MIFIKGTVPLSGAVPFNNLRKDDKNENEEINLCCSVDRTGNY